MSHRHARCLVVIGVAAGAAVRLMCDQHCRVPAGFGLWATVAAPVWIKSDQLCSAVQLYHHHV